MKWTPKSILLVAVFSVVWAIVIAPFAISLWGMHWSSALATGIPAGLLGRFTYNYLSQLFHVLRG